MINVHIPGFGDLELTHLVLDYNGTIAVNGILLTEVVSILNLLSEKLEVHVVTGDTYGTAKVQLAEIKCNLNILSSENQTTAKSDYIITLDSDKVVAIGNGRNDRQLLKEARVGIAVLGSEGTALETMQFADIVTHDIYSALGLLQFPDRLIATLRG